VRGVDISLPRKAQTCDGHRGKLQLMHLAILLLYRGAMNGSPNFRDVLTEDLWLAVISITGLLLLALNV